MICEAWEVIVVPFPFTEKGLSKRRPALVLTRASFNKKGHSTCAMITTKNHQPWPGDTLIKSREQAGLRSPCIVRLKLFTLDNRLILKRIGTLGEDDVHGVRRQMQYHFSLQE